MKRSELKVMVRKIVREEVAMAIQEVITELRKPATVQSPEVNVSSMEPAVEKKFSSNKVLNEVLNETANSDEWRNMGDKVYTSDSIGSILANQYKDMSNGASGKVSGEQMVASMGVSPESVPDHITKALSKEKSRQRR